MIRRTLPPPPPRTLPGPESALTLALNPTGGAGSDAAAAAGPTAFEPVCVVIDDIATDQAQDTTQCVAYPESSFCLRTLENLYAYAEIADGDLDFWIGTFTPGGYGYGGADTLYTLEYHGGGRDLTACEYGALVLDVSAIEYGISGAGMDIEVTLTDTADVAETYDEFQDWVTITEVNIPWAEYTLVDLTAIKKIEVRITFYGSDMAISFARIYLA